MRSVSEWKQENREDILKGKQEFKEFLPSRKDRISNSFGGINEIFLIVLFRPVGESFAPSIDPALSMDGKRILKCICDGWKMVVDALI